ncbi:MAG: EAL domain-containing protein, partial [Leptospirales bacterium]
MASDPAPRKIPQKEFWNSGLWLLPGLLIAIFTYFLIRADSIHLQKQIAKTNAFSNALVSLQKNNETLILDALLPDNNTPFFRASYQTGLFIQGKNLLDILESYRSLLPPRQKMVLAETGIIFGHIEKDLTSGDAFKGLLKTENHLNIRLTELSGWTRNHHRALAKRQFHLELFEGLLTLIILLTLIGAAVILLRKRFLFQKTSRQNHFYQALSRIDRLILDLPEIGELLPEACRIVVEEGGVWLARFVRCDVASGEGHLLSLFGNAPDEFNRSVLSSDSSTPEGRALWGETVRSKAPAIWNNILEHLEEGPVRTLYQQNGILSGAGFPIFRKDSFFGAFLFHSNEPDFFDPEIVKLIGILIENISFAINNRDREDERKAKEQEITRLSLFDSLTDLPNRRLFLDRTHQAMERHLRTHERFGVGILDLDGFKQVNDRLGHQAGDRLLIEVAHRLQGELRGMDTLARLGGDEFGIIFSALEKGKGSTLFDRIIGSLAQPFELGNEKVTIGGSLGITTIPPDTGDEANLLKHADIAMYLVKEHGKNGWERFRPAMTEALENTHRLKKELEQSFQEGRFVLHYQPQVDMGSGQMVGVEALLRWNHPKKGLLDSKQFINVLESSEIVLDVEKWVLEEILSQLSAWTDRSISPKVRMNIGARHLLSGHLIDNLKSAFSRHPGVSPHSLELDVTDARLFQDLQKVQTIFEGCRQLGVSMSIGNVGTEDGALSYIQTIGVDRLTIGRQLVRNLAKRPKNMAIVASLVTASQLFFIEVIGEGIETEAEGNLLLKWGCRIGQGFAIAPPMAPEKLEKWLEGYRPFASWSRWKQSPWEPRDYPLLMAREAVHAFYENFLEEIDKPGETRIEWTDSRMCLLGKWIDGEGNFRFGDLSEFNACRETHEHFHAQIRKAI